MAAPKPEAATPGLAAEVRRADAGSLLAALPEASVDLVYLDPPFNTGRDRRREGLGYADRWPDRAAWLAMIRAWVVAAHQALRPTGSILLHCDWRASHHLRLLLDEVFGEEQFVNHLVWSYGLGGSSPRRFARKHDDVLFYGRTDRYWFDPPRVPATSRRLAGRTKKATDVLDVPALNNMAHERCGWPTQKPLALLELLVAACAPPGGLVVDPCCGSGTTVVAAQRLGRRGLGGDVADEAVAIARRRLAADAAPITPREG